MKTKAPAPFVNTPLNAYTTAGCISVAYAPVRRLGFPSRTDRWRCDRASSSEPTSFSTGELDPLLRARVELEQYNNALAKATNVLIQPQGGLRRRPGTKHILELPNSSTPSAGNGVRLVPFQFSVTDSYMLCFTHQRMYIIKNGVAVANINGSGNNYLTTTVTSDMVDDMCWTQSADTLIVVHPDLQPVKIVRGRSPNFHSPTAKSCAT